MLRPLRRLFRCGGKTQPSEKASKTYSSKNVRLGAEALEERAVPSAIPFTGAAYAQNFDALIVNGVNQPWANDATLPGWSLFRQPAAAPVAITTYGANDGGNDAGSFYSFGKVANSDRALGGIASGDAYFGSPPSASVAGWIAVALQNKSGAPITSLTLRYDGEQWRDGGNTSAQTMALEFGFGSTLETVTTWTTQGGNFDFTSPVATPTAAALDGNVAGLAAGRGGTIATGFNWAVDSVLWLRWVENNDAGSDHGLALDNFSLSVPGSGGTTTIMGATSPSGYGNQITLSATVLPNPGIGNGTVKFFDNGNPIPAGAAVAIGAGGSASFQISSLAAGSHAITAVYSGGAGFAPSPTSAVVTQLVSPAVLTVTGITASDKVYDGAPSASLDISFAGLAGVVGTDVVTINTSGALGTFVNKNIGIGKTVSIAGLALSGPNASNYLLAPATVTADIVPLALTVSGISASDKTYNGDAFALLDINSAAITGAVDGDLVGLVTNGAQGTFNNKNAGLDKPVAVTGLALVGADAGNYTLAPPNVIADINPKGLTASAIPPTKLYDGTTSASVTYTLTGFVGAETVTASSGGVFASKDVGSRTVSLGTITLANGTNGGLATNYIIANLPANPTGTITPRPLTVTANNQTKTFGSTLTLVGTEFTSTGLQNGESIGSVTLNTPFGGAAATDPAGAYPIVPSAATGGTFSAANYSINYVPGALTVSGAANTMATVAPTTPSVYGTVVTLSATVTPSPGAGNGTVSFFDNGNPIPAGTMVAINAGGVASFQISSLSAGSHAITAAYNGGAGLSPSPPSAAVTQLVSPAVLAVTGITASDRTYDGNTTASLDVSFAKLVGVVGADNLVLNTANAAGDFNNKNVGIAKPVTVSGLTLSGATASNYTLMPPALTATIDPVLLTVSGITASDKTYDGSAVAALDVSFAVLSPPLSSEVVQLNAAGAIGNFIDKNVGTGKPVTITGLTLTGADAGNYAIAPLIVSADITALALTVTGVTANNKVFDGTTAATLNTAAASLVGVIAPDVVVLNSANAVGTFDSPNAGSNKTVTITGLTVNNPNYTLIQPTTTATIAPANTTTTLVANPQATTGGSLVTLTATVAPSPGAAGTVTFKDNGVPIAGGSNVALSGGVAIFSTTALSIGSHQIIADYTGSSNFAASTSNARSVVITGVATTTTLINNGPNPALLTQPINLTVTVGGGISTNGETVQVRDASNGNVLVASGTLAGGTASVTVPAGALAAGTHSLIAVYNGNNASLSSVSAPVAASVVGSLPQVISVTPNGNIAGLAGAQRSRIASLVVVFNQAVQLDVNAMTLALHTNNVSFNNVPQPAGFGSLPTTLVTSTVDNITWVVTFSGNTDNGLDGFNSLKDGVYSFKVDAAKVHASNVPTVGMPADSVTVFHRLFGDTDAPSALPGPNGIDFNARVASIDNLAMLTTFNRPASYNRILDFNGDGTINSGDNLQFRLRFNKLLAWSV